MRRSRHVWVVLLLSFGCREPRPATPPPSSFSLSDRIDAASVDYDETSFRSVRKDGRFVSPVTLEGRTELSLTPPIPSEIPFRLRVPERPVFRFATGVDSLGAESLPAAVDLEIFVQTDDGARTPVFSEIVRRHAANRWTTQEVELDRWAGRDVTLVLASRFRGASESSAPVLAAWGDAVVADASPKLDRPTVVLVSIDCLRADHVGAYGYPLDTTPSIDALAEGGIVFEKAFSTAPWTLPSHMSMLTGLLPSLHGATKWEKLAASVDYLPELLAGAGYRTAGVVSWVYLSQVYGFERGYDVYRVLEDPEASDVVDAAIEELGRGEGQAQFLFVHLFDPHWPYLPPPELVERFGRRPRDISTLLDKTSSSQPGDETEEEEVIRLYDAEIAFADRELGRLFAAMKARGLYDESLIIVTADHGEAFFEHGHWQHSQTLYDELIHVPLIVKPPGKNEPSRWPEPVSLVDIFVTASKSAGVDVATSSEGVLARASLLTPKDGPRTVLSEVTWRSPAGTWMKVALRDPSGKYMATFTGPVGDDLGVSELQDEALFDLSADPNEKTNLLDSGDRPAARRFRQELRAFFEAARAARSLRQGEAVELDDETLKKLETLGYVH